MAIDLRQVDVALFRMKREPPPKRFERALERRDTRIGTNHLESGDGGLRGAHALCELSLREADFVPELSYEFCAMWHFMKAYRA